ncbi:Nif3-like dinuclear metal center hexameric protein [bacterium]|nr:Nif3-like dinuclear metal center hexameric protein [bacterium]
MKTHVLAGLLDAELNVAAIADDSLNGLQVSNQGETGRVALAVDASAAAIRAAASCKADILIVHHGLFWGKSVSVTGPLYDRIRLLIHFNMALYAAHLPLDLHPHLGNNAVFGKMMGWPPEEDFGLYHGVSIGKAYRFRKPVPVQSIVKKVSDRLKGGTELWAFGKESISTVGVVSGRGLSLLDEAVRKGYDLFMTGEPLHEHYWQAKEAGINVLFGGHYATETLGIRALGDWLTRKHGLKTEFIDLPTGH